jgi:hypothetical protein
MGSHNANGAPSTSLSYYYYQQQQQQQHSIIIISSNSTVLLLSEGAAQHYYSAAAQLAFFFCITINQCLNRQHQVSTINGATLFSLLDRDDYCHGCCCDVGAAVSMPLMLWIVVAAWCRGWTSCILHTQSISSHCSFLDLVTPIVVEEQHAKTTCINVDSSLSRFVNSLLIVVFRRFALDCRVSSSLSIVPIASTSIVEIASTSIDSLSTQSVSARRVDVDSSLSMLWLDSPL